MDSPSQPGGVHLHPDRRRRGRLRRLAWLFLGAAALVHFLWLRPFWGIGTNSSRHGRVPLTPAWALECWLWEDDANTAEAVRELLEGYRAHDIPVRTVLLDSPWSRRYNDFAFDTHRYPDPAGFLGGLQRDGYRVVLWMTPNVNSRSRDTVDGDSDDFHRGAQERGFLAGGGREIDWWKGRGGFIDYTNPAARDWWHGLQRQVLEWGVDGWKLDGTDTLFSSFGFLPYQRTHSGWMSTREYMDLYNREEYRHGLSVNPEFVVLTRGIDDRYFPLSHPEGFAPLDASPVTWVGDRTHEWSSTAPGGSDDTDALLKTTSWRDRGFEGAIRDILASARRGYAVVGDDVAGYHGKEPIPPHLYIRWAQFAAFTPLFLNGGHGERRLWKRSPEELEQVRRFSWIHTELVPYLHTLVAQCHEGGPTPIRPTGSGYDFTLGESLFISPIHRDSPSHTAHLPPGRWRFLLQDGEPLEGGTDITRDYAMDEYPVFVREGSALPLDVRRAYSGFGDGDSEGLLTWAVWPGGEFSSEVRHTDGTGSSGIRVSRASALQVELEGVPKPHRLRIRLDAAATEVRYDGRVLEEGRDWIWSTASGHLIITSRTARNGLYKIQQPGSARPGSVPQP
jgi:alpha-glucosidase (family GH31 glycosyl hydrolase)